MQNNQPVSVRVAPPGYAEKKDSLLMQRVGAKFIDALVLGFGGTFTVALFLFAMGACGVDGLSTSQFLSTCDLAFLIGFFDVLNFSGFLVLALVIFCLAAFTFDSTAVSFQVPALLSLAPLNFLYHLLFEGRVGATPGKQLTGLKLVKLDGSKAAPEQVVSRQFSKIVSASFVLLPFIHLLFGTRTQMFHDFLCGTKIIGLSDSASEPDNESTKNVEVQCASLFRRVPAALLDCLLVCSVETMVVTALVYAGAYLLPAPNSSTEAYVLLFATQAIAFILALLAAMSVIAAFEAGPWQASPGKAFMNLRVTDLGLGQISFRQAFLKQIVQAFVYVSLIPVALIIMGGGFLLFLSGKASWLDPAYLGILGWGVFYLIYGAFACFTVYRNRQTVIDRYSSRYVIVDNGKVEELTLRETLGETRE